MLGSFFKKIILLFQDKFSLWWHFSPSPGASGHVPAGHWARTGSDVASPSRWIYPPRHDWSVLPVTTNHLEKLWPEKATPLYKGAPMGLSLRKCFKCYSVVWDTTERWKYFFAISPIRATQISACVISPLRPPIPPAPRGAGHMGWPHSIFIDWLS